MAIDLERVADSIEAVWDCPEEDDERLVVYARAAALNVLEQLKAEVEAEYGSAPGGSPEYAALSDMLDKAKSFLEQP